jgi:hypothetical protein
MTILSRVIMPKEQGHYQKLEGRALISRMPHSLGVTHLKHHRHQIIIFQICSTKYPPGMMREKKGKMFPKMKPAPPLLQRKNYA